MIIIKKYLKSCANSGTCKYQTFHIVIGFKKIIDTETITCYPISEGEDVKNAMEYAINNYLNIPSCIGPYATIITSK